jgi:hypothetical protein
MIGKLREQIEAQVKLKKIAPVSAEQFFITLASSCMFPFVARPMLAEVLGVSSEQLLGLIEQRRTALPAFLKRALRL